MFQIRSLRSACAAAALILTLAPAAPALAEQSLLSDIGLGVSSGVCTLAYAPLKIAYAAGGTMVASLVYMWTAGNVETTRQVLRRTAGGDYVVTREHLRGLRVLEIAG
jgi:hypothetical protein